MSFAGGGRLRAGEDERERLIKRGVAGAIVVLLHVAIFFVFVSVANFVQTERQPKEVVLLLPPLVPKSDRVRPPEPQPIPLPDAHPVPGLPHTITIPDEKQPPPPPPQPRTDTDVMQAIGKELACGAGPWEHLTQAQREACKRNPWKFKKNAKGIIVLDVNKPPPADLGEPETGADQDLHIQQTADPCLAAGNTHSECIHKSIFGR